MQARIALFVLTTVTLANAAETDVVRPRDAISPADLSLAGHVGGFGDTDDEGGAVLGASGLFRYGPVGVGGLAESGGAVFGYSYSGFAALGGLAIAASPRIRLQLLGSYGMHSYSGVGRGFLSDDPGASGTSPYVGARAGVSHLFGSKATRFSLGLVAALDEDLERKTVSYQYTDDGWFGGPSERESEQTIGTRRTSVLVSLGANHDFW